MVKFLQMFIKCTNVALAHNEKAIKRIRMRAKNCRKTIQANTGEKLPKPHTVGYV